ncbi:hypothetical protein F4818DRAFT_438098 [Hypoxylon cercidicola]|nr:hypothetical protein F4818DRAFT_438098 [Hypoxylon cercidicola]
MASQEPQQAQVTLEGCDALACSSTTCNPVYSTSDQPDDVTSPRLEAYERTLYAGLPSSLFKIDGTEGNRLPASCVLMLQDQSQTFPIPSKSTQGGSMNGTTTCADILDQDCLNMFTSFITFFDSSGHDSVADCAAHANHANHANTQIHFGDIYLCGFYAKLITVTGALMLNTSSNSSIYKSLTQDECRPTLTQSNNLCRVGSVQTIVEDSDECFGSDIFGGRRGYTAVITVVYDGGGNLPVCP